MKTLALLVLILNITLGSASVFAASPIAPVEQGLLEGTEQNGVISFKGIPFAQPPVGALRWQLPLAPKSWEGVRPAKEFSPVCFQTQKFDADTDVIGTEDCLYLNIWRPAGETGPLPVLFFIHGGAFAWGSGRGNDMNDLDLYDGTYLAEHGPAVVVTINYRLGVLGFLADESLRQNGLAGNYGLADQIAALEWVKKNIPNFGGDPSRLMIFGESAGAFSVLGLLTSPFAQGLFSRALSESGSDIRDTAERASQVANEFTAQTPCASAADRAACLRALNPQEIMRIEKKMLHGKGAHLVFSPYIDGHFIPEPPLAAFRAGRYHHVPLLIGSNADEMSTLGFPYLREKIIVTRKNYVDTINEEVGPERGAQVVEFYDRDSSRSSYGKLKDAFSDFYFHCPAREVARAVVKQQPGQVWRYYFTHSFHLYPARFFGAGHTMELGYVFHNHRTGLLEMPDEDELRLSERMAGYWTRFAATGNPNGAGDTLWPEYRETSDDYLELEVDGKAGAGIRSEACDFWYPSR